MNVLFDLIAWIYDRAFASGRAAHVVRNATLALIKKLLDVWQSAPSFSA
jgi:hypothetical protein